MAMQLDHEQLHRLLEALGESDIQEFRLEGDDFRLEIRRNLPGQRRRALQRINRERIARLHDLVYCTYFSRRQRLWRSSLLRARRSPGEMHLRKKHAQGICKREACCHGLVLCHGREMPQHPRRVFKHSLLEPQVFNILT